MLHHLHEPLTNIAHGLFFFQYSSVFIDAGERQYVYVDYNYHGV